MKARPSRIGGTSDEWYCSASCSSHFSWSLTDAAFVTLDWTNAHVSINGAQASLDADGVLRVVLSAIDPGTPNWLQTTGHRSGVLQCRTVGSDQPPEMTARVIPLGAVFEHLPADTRHVTPAERTAELRQRQIGSQMRRLW